MRRLSREDRAQILALQVEGNSIRSTCRLTGRSKITVTRLIVEAGQACAEAHGAKVRGLNCQQVQVDELRAFVGMKQKRVPAERSGEFGIGDVWTFTSIDPETKLIPTWLIGRRDATSARQFLVDLGRRIRGRFQLTSDGASFYREAAEQAFGGHIDYAQLVKLYSSPADGERTYSPPVCVAAVPTRISGDPDVANISTSHVERQNLNIRMSMRRFTRLTNAFSKKVFNLSCAVALYVFYYNFVRPHTTLTKAAHGKPTTPAMAAGLADKPWTLADIVKLVEDREDTAEEVAKRRKDRRESK